MENRCFDFINKVIFDVQVTVSEEGSISGTLQRSKKSKKNWKRLWFLLKDKVLYTYRAQEVRRNHTRPIIPLLQNERVAFSERGQLKTFLLEDPLQ